MKYKIVYSGHIYTLQQNTPLSEFIMALFPFDYVTIFHSTRNYIYRLSINHLLSAC